MHQVRRDIPIAELAGFLERPITAVLATFRVDGTVLLSPVWHEWRDGGFNVGASRGNGHVVNIRRDPRVSLVVPGQEPPWIGVEIRCEARIHEDGVDEVVRRIAARYEGRERPPEEYSDSVVLRLDPGELRTWDFADGEG